MKFRFPKIGIHCCDAIVTCNIKGDHVETSTKIDNPVIAGLIILLLAEKLIRQTPITKEKILKMIEENVNEEEDADDDDA